MTANVTVDVHLCVCLSHSVRVFTDTPSATVMKSRVNGRRRVKGRICAVLAACACGCASASEASRANDALTAGTVSVAFTSRHVGASLNAEAGTNMGTTTALTFLCVPLLFLQSRFFLRLHGLL